MISLGIKCRGEGQNMGRAEFDAESTTLAALHSNGNETLGQDALLERDSGEVLALIRPNWIKGVFGLLMALFRPAGFDIFQN